MDRSSDRRPSSRLEQHEPGTIFGGVSPSVSAFATVAGTEFDEAHAPVQCHPDAAAELLDDARSAGTAELAHIAVQAYAAALLAGACLGTQSDDPAPPRASSAP
ncbi:MAG: hypothetical protein OXG37_11330 [Actinomycetia bacterium]|nr:hypothetical protein [Actinomycetes bacterium]